LTSAPSFDAVAVGADRRLRRLVVDVVGGGGALVVTGVVVGTVVAVAAEGGSRVTPTWATTTMAGWSPGLDNTTPSPLTGAELDDALGIGHRRRLIDRIGSRRL
jgi:hypothetical protein